MQLPTYARYFQQWSEPWHFADREETRRLLEEAGFGGAQPPE